MAKRIPDEDLLAEIRRLAEKLGEVPGKNDMDELGEYSRGPYQTRFGSWNEAVRAAGLSPREPGERKGKPHNHIPDEDLLDELRRLAEELGEVPLSTDMRDHGKYSGVVYSQRFGGWHAAVKEAGLDPKYGVDIPKENLIEEIHRLADEHGRTPTIKLLEEDGEYSAPVYWDRFGSWNSALREAGHDVNVRYDITPGELVDDLQRLYQQLGRPPRQPDVCSEGSYSVRSYCKAFGSWTNALIEAGFSDYIHGRVPPDERAEPSRNYYGPNWPQRRKEIVERDGGCVDCGIPRSRALSEFSVGLHVHHIVPIAEFDSYEEANTHDNLVALCPSCHPRWEAMSPLRPVTAAD